jgi:hypothetical protein
MAVNPIKVWNGTAWEYTGPVVAAPPVKYQATAPTSPATGDVWVESDYDVASVDPSKLLTGGVYTNESTRSAAIPTPTTGMVTYVGDTGTDPSTIPQLEAYNGTAWQGLGGLTQVANVSFTAVASISLDNVFTTAYTNYALVSTIFSDANNRAVNFVLRAGGVNLTSGAYTSANTVVTDGGVGTSTGAIAATSFEWTRTFGNAAVAALQVGTISQLTASSRKYLQRTTSFNNGTNFVQQVSSCEINGTTSHDGFSLIAPAGTITGNVRVYGLRNS